MNDKQLVEVEITRRALALMGHGSVELVWSDRPDVVARIGPQQIGIEVVQFHADEHAKGLRGSALRRAEQRDAGRVKAYWTPADPVPALVAHITHKNGKARVYPWGGPLWLLIATQVPMIGAVSATHVFEPFLAGAIEEGRLDGALQDTPYDTVCLYLGMGSVVYSWAAADRKWRRFAK